MIVRPVAGGSHAEVVATFVAGQPAQYGAHYVAATERMGAELWTADRRLLKHYTPLYPKLPDASEAPR